MILVHYLYYRDRQESLSYVAYLPQNVRKGAFGCYFLAELHIHIHYIWNLMSLFDHVKLFCIFVL